jgi:crooked neck
VQYEETVAENPLNYDTWFDYLKLEESLSAPDVVRGVYERAVANIPLINQKRHWCRYIYLWIYYAIYEELLAEDVGRAREVYRTCLKIIPHKDFTFAKIWILAAQLEVLVHTPGGSGSGCVQNPPKSLACTVVHETCNCA